MINGNLSNDIVLDFDDVLENSFEALPAGEYVARCIGLAVNDNKAKSGKILNVEFDIVDGPLQGRKVFEMFNIQHPSREAVKIAVGQLKQWMQACFGQAPSGRLNLQEIAALEGQICVLKLKIEKDSTGQYQDKNRIAAFKAANGYTPPAPQANWKQSQGAETRTAAPSPTPQAQPKQNNAPWLKK